MNNINKIAIIVILVVGYRAIVILVVGYRAIVYNSCAITSYHGYKLCDSIGLDAEVCCGTVTFTDEYDHAWLRVNGINIETSSLNIIKSPYCDYNGEYFVSSDNEEIKCELKDDLERGLFSINYLISHIKL